LEIPAAADFQSTAGSGAEGNVEGASYRVGSGKWFREHGADGFEALETIARPLQEIGRTCVWFGRRDGGKTTALCVFALADTIRPEAKSLVRGLHAAGVRKVVMLTGDHESVARTIAAEVGIDEIHASLSPGDKLRIIGELRKQGPVMMVGDGVNDAPALAQADLGMAMGAAGADVAMETADVVLMGDRLENIPLFLAHARRARRVMLQNLTFAAAVICVLIVAALGWKLPLPLGLVGHEGSTVLVCLNGLRLLMFRGAATGAGVAPASSIPTLNAIPAINSPPPVPQPRFPA
jgi:Cd2+/Zn2+-exporting ATPase